MGRPRAFSETAVLDAAIGEFRVHGFDATTTEQLCEASGVRRSSLYNAFESKDALFERALERYIEVIRGLQVEILGDDTRTGADRLRALINLVIDEEREARTHGRAAGCMVVHSFMNPDLRAHEPRVQSMLERDLAQRTELLIAAIRAGQIDGSVTKSIDPNDAATLIHTIVSGLRVTAQSGVAPEALRRVALTGLSALFA